MVLWAVKTTEIKKDGGIVDPILIQGDNTGGGYCGELSIQSTAMAFGAWISQDLIRRASNHGEGNGDL